MPSWVTFDSSTLEISGTAPLVAQATNYTFYIKSAWTDNFPVTVQKAITIQVGNTEDTKDVEDTEIPTTTAGTVAVTSAQTTLAAGSALILVSSLLSRSSPTAMWSLVNQQQMIGLLMLIDSSTPNDFNDYLEGTSFVNFNFNFIPTTEVPYLNWPANKMEIELDDRKLNALGINSGSTFVNLFSTIVIVIVVILIHIVLLLLPNAESSSA
jgi:hypothetical protein